MPKLRSLSHSINRGRAYWAWPMHKYTQAYCLSSFARSKKSGNMDQGNVFRLLDTRDSVNLTCALILVPTSNMFSVVVGMAVLSDVRTWWPDDALVTTSFLHTGGLALRDSYAHWCTLESLLKGFNSVNRTYLLGGVGACIIQYYYVSACLIFQELLGLVRLSFCTFVCFYKSKPHWY